MIENLLNDALLREDDRLITLIILDSIRKLEDEKLQMKCSGTYHDITRIDFHLAGRKMDLITYLN